MKKRLFVSVCVAAVAALSAAPSHGAQTELVVDDDGAQCAQAGFTSVQAAVNAASPGATIRVCPGTYNEVVTVNKANLQLVGPRTPPVCTDSDAPDPDVDAVVQASNAAGGVVNLLANGIRFQRFTVQNNTLGSGVLTGAGFSGHNVAENTVQNNELGVYFNSNGATPSAVQQNCIRQNNQAGAASGTGVYSGEGLKNADISENTFFRNSSSGITLTGTLPGAVDDVDIDENVSRQDGSLLAIFNSTNTDVRANDALNNTGSAIFVGNDNTGLRIRSNIIDSGARGVRTSTAFGGNASTDVSIISNRITNSTSTTGDGVNVSANSLTGSLIASNTATNNPRDGIRIDAGGNAGNRIYTNTLRNNGEHDCHDDTTGTGTAGTANTWRGNAGVTENRPGLCRGTTA
jgi:hypothetical protein